MAVFFSRKLHLNMAAVATVAVVSAVVLAVAARSSAARSASRSASRSDDDAPIRLTTGIHRYEGYSLHVHAPAGDAPVLVLLHGSGGNGRRQMRLWHNSPETRPLFDRYIVVAPTWNTTDASFGEREGPVGTAPSRPPRDVRERRPARVVLRRLRGRAPHPQRARPEQRRPASCPRGHRRDAASVPCLRRSARTGRVRLRHLRERIRAEDVTVPCAHPPDGERRRPRHSPAGGLSSKGRFLPWRKSARLLAEATGQGAEPLIVTRRPAYLRETRGDVVAYLLHDVGHVAANRSDVARRLLADFFE